MERLLKNELRGIHVNMEAITVEELLKKINRGESVYLLDVRDEQKFRTGSIELKGLIVQNIPYIDMTQESSDAKMKIARLPENTQIVTVCTTGNKAQSAAALLREQGLSVVSLQGGLTAWKATFDGEKGK